MTAVKMKAAAVLSSTAKAMTYNMALQFTLRISTFLLNAVVLRYVSRDLLGVVNVRLTLLYSTTLFLTKEAFERACSSRAEGRDWRHVINLMWCTAPLALVWSVLLGTVWLYMLETPEASVVPHYSAGVVAFAVSSCVEVWAEPLFVTGQAFLFVKLKVLALGISQTIKVSMTVTLVWARPEWGLLSFSIAQIVSSVSFVLIYYVYFVYHITWQAKKDDDEQLPLSSVRDFFPQVVPGKSFLDDNLTHLTWSFFKQSFLKQILTEGERYVMTFLDVLSFADQGVYDVINNLGSIVARFVFLPVEENGYLFFSHLLARGKSAHEQPEEAMHLASSVLAVLLKVVTLIGSMILVFGYSNSYLALYIYGGETLSSGVGPTLLRWYCLYVLVIAINGTTESFVFATMSKDQVDKYNKKMVVFSIIFLLLAWYLTGQLGSVGFVLANCLNMAARIVHSVIFIQRFFSGSHYRPLFELIPSRPVLGGLVISLIVTAISEVYFCQERTFYGAMAHIGVSGVCLVAVLILVYMTEQNMVRVFREHFLKKSLTQSR